METTIIYIYTYVYIYGLYRDNEKENGDYHNGARLGPGFVFVIETP